jgi:hypothetical protein
MNTQIYVIVSIVVLALIAFLFFFVSGKKKENRLTPLAGLAFGFILAGILFGSDQRVGYSLLGVGVLLAVIDIVMKLRKK